MKININKIVLHVKIVVLLFAAYSCNDVQRNSDEPEQETKTEETAGDHGEEEGENTVSLTKEQLKTWVLKLAPLSKRN